MSDIWAVIPAAGIGQRSGLSMPKQYFSIRGKPMLQHALERLLSHSAVAGAIVALHPEDRHWPAWDTLLGKPLRTVVGGATRAASVRAAVSALANSVSSDVWALVHDAARPCVSTGELTRLIATATSADQPCILGLPVTDTVKRVGTEHRIEETVPREPLWRALTPQLCRAALLLQALDHAEQHGLDITDESSALEAMGVHPSIVPGEPTNIKLTTPADIALVELFLSLSQTSQEG